MSIVNLTLDLSKQKVVTSINAKKPTVAEGKINLASDILTDTSSDQSTLQMNLDASKQKVVQTIAGVKPSTAAGNITIESNLLTTTADMANNKVVLTYDPASTTKTTFVKTVNGTAPDNVGNVEKPYAEYGTGEGNGAANTPESFQAYLDSIPKVMTSNYRVWAYNYDTTLYPSLTVTVPGVASGRQIAFELYGRYMADGVFMYLTNTSPIVDVWRGTAGRFEFHNTGSAFGVLPHVSLNMDNPPAVLMTTPFIIVDGVHLTLTAGNLQNLTWATNTYKFELRNNATLLSLVNNPIVPANTDDFNRWNTLHDGSATKAIFRDGTIGYAGHTVSNPNRACSFIQVGATLVFPNKFQSSSTTDNTNTDVPDNNETPVTPESPVDPVTPEVPVDPVTPEEAPTEPTNPTEK